MRRRRISLLVAILFCVGCGAFAQSKKPVRRIDVDFIAPSSFEALWEQADVIAHVKVLGSRGEAEPRTIGRPAVFTAHDVRVLEAFRGPREIDAGRELRLLQRAGTVETADEQLVIVGEHVLRAGGEYVLFLAWNAEYESYELWLGGYGVYELDAGKVKPAKSDRVSKERADMPREEFRKDVRARKVDRH